MNSAAESAIPWMNPQAFTSVITVRQTQVDKGWCWTLLTTQTHTHTHTWPRGYKRVVDRSLQCRRFQETADMFRFLVLTSLAALGKNCLLLLWHFCKKQKSFRSLERLMADCCTFHVSTLSSAGWAPAQVSGGWSYTGESGGWWGGQTPLLALAGTWYFTNALKSPKNANQNRMQGFSDFVNPYFIPDRSSVPIWRLLLPHLWRDPDQERMGHDCCSLCGQVRVTRDILMT